MTNFVEWRLIKNPVTGVKDTVIGKRKEGSVILEEPMLIDNPVYLEWLAQGGATAEDTVD